MSKIESPVRRLARRHAGLLVLLSLVVTPAALYAAQIALPHLFADGTIASASQVNANLATLRDAVNGLDERVGTLEGGGGGGGGGGASSGAQLPGTASAAGSLFLVTTTSQLYVSSGASWLPTGVPLLDAPTNFISFSNGSGLLVANWTAAPRAISYEWRYQLGTTLDAGATLLGVSGISANASGLTDLSTYSVAVRSVAGSLRSAWTAPMQVVVGAPGSSSAAPAQSCKVILQQQPGIPSGLYWVNVAAGGVKRVYCDLDATHDGGGWTLLLSSFDPGHIAYNGGTTFPTDPAVSSTGYLKPSDLGRSPGTGQVRLACRTAASFDYNLRFNYVTAFESWAWQSRALTNVSTNGAGSSANCLQNRAESGGSLPMTFDSTGSGADIVWGECAEPWCHTGHLVRCNLSAPSPTVPQTIWYRE